MRAEEVPDELADILGQKLYDENSEGCAAEGCDGHPSRASCQEWARELLAAVLPAIRADERAKVAEEIKAAACDCHPDRKPTFTCPIHGWAAQRERSETAQILLDLAARWRDRRDPALAAAAEEMLDQFGDAFLAAARGGA